MGRNKDRMLQLENFRVYSRNIKYKVAKLKRIEENYQKNCAHPLRVSDKIEDSTFCKCLLCNKDLEGNLYKNYLHRIIIIKKPETFDEKAKLYHFHKAFYTCVNELSNYNILDIVKVFRDFYENYNEQEEDRIDYAYNHTIKHFNEPKLVPQKTKKIATIK
jgi:hypothetical protein